MRHGRWTNDSRGLWNALGGRDRSRTCSTGRGGRSGSGADSSARTASRRCSCCRSRRRVDARSGCSGTRACRGGACCCRSCCRSRPHPARRRTAPAQPGQPAARNHAGRAGASGYGADSRYLACAARRRNDGSGRIEVAGHPACRSPETRRKQAVESGRRGGRWGRARTGCRTSRDTASGGGASCGRSGCARAGRGVLARLGAQRSNRSPRR